LIGILCENDEKISKLYLEKSKNLEDLTNKFN